MTAIGLGKHEGASSIHRSVFPSFQKTVTEIAKFILSKGKIIFGVASVENGHERIMRLEVIPPEKIADRERELLVIAKKSMARLPFEKLDILVIDEIGKNISGAGMDPNVTGRPAGGVPFPGTLDVKTIVVLGLTPETHGNATGIGAAEITTRGVVEQVDLASTYINNVTSGVVRVAAIPLVAKNAHEAVRVAYFCVPSAENSAALVHIRSTLALEEFEVSENMLPEILKQPDVFTVLEGPYPMKFDRDGELKKIC
jgi:hypothetical protein